MKDVMVRALRSLVSTVAGVAIAKWQNDPRYIWIVPALQGAGKALRVKWPKLAPWLPF